MNEHHSGCQFDLYPSGHARDADAGWRAGAAVPRASPSGRSRASAADLEFWERRPRSAFVGDLSGVCALRCSRRKRELGASIRGTTSRSYSDEQLTDNYHYTVFPNISFSIEARRLHLAAGDPAPDRPASGVTSTCGYLTLFPAGLERVLVELDAATGCRSSTRSSTRPVSPARCRAGPGIDQDVAIWKTQQQGLRSRGFRGEYMPWQERRIRYFHDTIDQVDLARGPVDALDATVDLDGTDGERFELGDLTRPGRRRAAVLRGRRARRHRRVPGPAARSTRSTDNCSHADTPLSGGRSARVRARRARCTGPRSTSATDAHSGPPAWEGRRVPPRSTESDGVAVVVLAERSGGDGGPSDPTAAGLRSPAERF